LRAPDIDDNNLGLASVPFAFRMPRRRGGPCSILLVVIFFFMKGGPIGKLFFLLF
jgi:hypothetical protein